MDWWLLVGQYYVSPWVDTRAHKYYIILYIILYYIILCIRKKHYVIMLLCLFYVSKVCRKVLELATKPVFSIENNCVTIIFYRKPCVFMEASVFFCGLFCFYCGELFVFFSLRESLLFFWFYYW